MSPEQLGYLTLGLVALISAFKLAYDVFVVPHQNNRNILRDKEIDAIREMNTLNLKNLEYQKEIVAELAKLNTSLGYEASKLNGLEQEVKNNTNSIGDLKGRVQVLENK